MPPPKIAQVVVDLPLESSFDYAIGATFQDKIAIGKRVKVLFNRRETVGVVVGFKDKSRFFKLNPIIDILDTNPSVSSEILKLCEQLSDYYGCSQGEAIFSYLPNALRKSQRVDIPAVSFGDTKDFSQEPKCFLLHDVTLQKSWEFIFEKTKKVLEAGKSAVFLMPSVEFIEQMELKIKEVFHVPIFILDKKLTPKQELESWLEIKKGTPCIVLGTLSAVFAPTPHLGLIAIYEEENMVYKQEQTPFLRMQKVAEFRFQIEGAQVIFSSVCPSIETYQYAKEKKWEMIRFFPEKYSAFQLIDMSNYKSQKATFLSFPLQNLIYQSLEQNKRIVLVMNRKGFTTTTRCSCGFIMRCSRCDVSMTYRYAKKKLVCRHCGEEQELPKVCPSCKAAYLHSSGGGIEKLESEVARVYPQAQVACYDSDTKSFPEKANLIIATQAITKTQWTMSFDIIAVIDFDAQLNRFDFRCANKLFSLLVLLRQMAKEKLLVQTTLRNEYVLHNLEKMDFEGFYKKELMLRKELGFPPSKHLLSMMVRGKNEDFVFEQTKKIYDLLKIEASSSIDISDPHPDVVPKLRDKYRFTIVLKSKSTKNNLKLAKKALNCFKRRKDLVVTINVDP